VSADELLAALSPETRAALIQRLKDDGSLGGPGTVTRATAKAKNEERAAGLPASIARRPRQSPQAREGDRMNYYALFYVVADFAARRAAYREEHLRLAREAHRRGELLLAGALADPADRALLIFRAADRSVAEEFARNDPYVTHGLITRWEVRPWTVVIGNEPADAGPKVG
jgi:uncharacterized protein YciI